MKTEIQAKDMLRRYGISVTSPMLATNESEAEALAITIGKPVAMKVVSPDIVHKVKAGGVRLNVSPSKAKSTFIEIMQACSISSPGAQLDGVLVEEIISGSLEVFIGARIDKEYGPVVLLGYGGSRVEEGNPPLAALAPLTKLRAEEMVSIVFGDDLMSTEAFQKLVHYLLSIAGNDGLIFKEEINDLDVNPIIIEGDRAIAVDAVVDDLDPDFYHRLLDENQVAKAKESRLERLSGIQALFNPKSIAFIGASTSPQKLGYRNIKNLLDYGFDGQLFPIHPSASEICGIPAYRSILEVPGKVDRAYIAVSAPQVPKALAECSEKGVSVAQVLTAGFSEHAGTEENPDDALLEILERSTLRMVGPNCIGTFSSTGRLAMGASRLCPSPDVPGGITFISQSGTFAGDLARRAKVWGLPVGQILSCGNCLDLDLIDYLLYCDEDSNTNIISIYTESIKDPGLFFRIASTIKKPIILFRGGLTKQGNAAASSHTAALATDQALWAASIRDTGILQVDTLDDLIDVLLCYSAHGSLSGNRLGLFGSGGGVSVTCSDTADRMGLHLPPLNEDTSQRLIEYAGPGTSVGNPIDIPVWGLRRKGLYIIDEIINALKEDSHIDVIISYVEMGTVMDFVDNDEDGILELQDICDSIRRINEFGSPVCLVLRSTGDKLQDDLVREQRLSLLSKGISVFSSTNRAVRAMGMLWELSVGTKSRCN